MGKLIDLTGRRFGRLTVIEKTERRDGSAVVWRCRCDCGKVVDVSARHLLHSGTVSCGCNRRERSLENLSGPIEGKLGQISWTNVSLLRITKAQVNNKSGYRGVSWQKNRHGGGTWIAVIYFKGTRYGLGSYATPKEASEAYLTAKEHIHGAFVAWYEEYVEKRRMAKDEGESSILPEDVADKDGGGSAGRNGKDHQHNAVSGSEGH